MKKKRIPKQQTKTPFKNVRKRIVTKEWSLNELLISNIKKKWKITHSKLKEKKNEKKKYKPML